MSVGGQRAICRGKSAALSRQGCRHHLSSIVQSLRFARGLKSRRLYGALTCDHAPLTHSEARNDGQGEYSKCNILRHDLNKVRSEGLAEIGIENIWNRDDGVGYDKLKEPAKDPADG